MRPGAAYVIHSNPLLNFVIVFVYIKNSCACGDNACLPPLARKRILTSTVCVVCARAIVARELGRELRAKRIGIADFATYKVFTLSARASTLVAVRIKCCFATSDESSYAISQYNWVPVFLYLRRSRITTHQSFRLVGEEFRANIRKNDIALSVLTPSRQQSAHNSLTNDARHAALGINGHAKFDVTRYVNLRET